MNNWQYHDKKMKELKKLYLKTSKQTQNRLQEIFESIDFTFDNLYNIADREHKDRINTYIEEWKEKGLLTGYFGLLARNIYNRTRVKNSEILELLIYGAYIEEQSKLKEQELNIMYDDVNYYYQEGQQEVYNTLPKKERKPMNILKWALFLALLDEPNVKGYVFEQYIQVTIQFNAQQIYRQMTIDLQQQKQPDITNDIYQNLIKRQNNSKLSINGDKISGDIDAQLIGVNNLAKIEGIKEKDNNAQVRFIAIIDGKETDMCHSLDNQIFYINKENTFDRYYGETQKDLRIERIKCKGLVLGLNLPPISHHFHWCRSTITYQVSVEDDEENWYNKLGNSNKDNFGGSGKGIFIEQIAIKEVSEKIKEYEEQIRNMKTEYGVLIDEEGNIYAYSGTETNLDITDRTLDNVILTHNHPEVSSFGKDDFELIKVNPKIKELRAVDKEYNYSLKLKKPIDISYNEIYIKGLQKAFETGEEPQHCAMLVLKEMVYINYDRRGEK